MGIGLYGIGIKVDRQYCIAKQYEIRLLKEARQKEIAKNTNCVTKKHTKMPELLHLICHNTRSQTASSHVLSVNENKRRRRLQKYKSYEP